MTTAATPDRTSSQQSSRLRTLSEEVRTIEEKLRQGGGVKKIAKLHEQGKLSARERVAQLCDPNSRFIEIGLFIAYDQYDGQAPGAGVVTGLGEVHGRSVVVVANDPTVKAGSWWPENDQKDPSRPRSRHALPHPNCVFGRQRWRKTSHTRGGVFPRPIRR